MYDLCAVSDCGEGRARQAADEYAIPGVYTDLDDMLSTEKPDVVARLDADLRAVVDYDRVHRDWLAYCKGAFRQWRRQAQRGLYVDSSYALRGAPSNDYWKIMDNSFTGYNQDDERKVVAWLGDDAG